MLGDREPILLELFLQAAASPAGPAATTPTQLVNSTPEQRMAFARRGR